MIIMGMNYYAVKKPMLKMLMDIALQEEIFYKISFFYVYLNIERKGDSLRLEETK